MKNHYRFILFFLLGFWMLAIIGCTSASNGAINKKPPIARVPTKITSYPLVDYKGELHKYRDNFDSFVFPQHNQKLTQYCAFHYEWENIKVKYAKDENGEWGYTYIVSKNKRRNRFR